MDQIGIDIQDASPKRRAALTWPKALKDPMKRRNFAATLADLITHGANDRIRLTERIKRNESLMANEQLPANRKEDWEPNYHIGLVKPRIKKSSQKIQETIFASDPWFHFRGVRDVERQHELEELIQWNLEMGGFMEAVSEAVETSQYRGVAIIRVMYTEDDEGLPSAPVNGPYYGAVYETIHPLDFVAHPGTSDPLETQLFHGHKFSLMLADAKAEQIAGRWAPMSEVVLYPRNSVANKTEHRELQRTSSLKDDSDMVDLYDLIVRWDLSGRKTWNPTLYRVILDAENRQLLSCSEYGLAASWYEPINFETDDGHLFNENCRAQDLQGIQLIFNQVFNEFLTGSMYSSRPPTLAEGGTDGAANKRRSKPGEIIRTNSLSKVSTLSGTFNGAPFPLILSFLREVADMNSAVSDTMTGAPSNADSATATEQRIKFRAFQMSGNADIRTVRTALRSLVRKTVMLLITYYDRWAEIYQEEFQVPLDVLKGRYRCVLATESMDDTPEQQMQYAQMLLGLSQQMPDLGLPVYDLVKTIVASTRLPYVEDILEKIDIVQKRAEAQEIQQAMAYQMIQRIIASRGQAEAPNAENTTLPAQTPGTPGVSGLSLLAADPAAADQVATGEIPDTQPA